MDRPSDQLPARGVSGRKAAHLSCIFRYPARTPGAIHARQGTTMHHWITKIPHDSGAGKYTFVADYSLSPESGNTHSACSMASNRRDSDTPTLAITAIPDMITVK